MGAHVVVDQLTVTAGEATLVDALSFTIRPGEVLALIGESGSGKTTTALALMGHARHGCRISGGSVRIGEIDVLSLGARQLRALRGRTVSYIAQSAAASFDPSRAILDQVVEPAVVHGTLPRGEAERKAIALFRELALPEPEIIGRRYPHQVSGGQLQRLMAAMALITDPEVVILDEPTTALDVTTQLEVLRAFRRVVRERQVTAVYVSHDLAVVAQMADHILVLRDGRMREVGATERLLAAPENDYTQSLLAAARPAPRVAAPASADAELLLRVQGLSAGYGPRGRDGKPAVTILEDVDLDLRRGQAIGVIGESGSGKTTLARVVAGLLPPSAGTVAFDGHALPPALGQRSRDDLRRIQIVFQSADTALNPSQTVERILARPLQFYRGLKGAALQRRIDELLDLVKPHRRHPRRRHRQGSDARGPARARRRGARFGIGLQLRPLRLELRLLREARPHDADRLARPDRRPRRDLLRRGRLARACPTTCRSGLAPAQVPPRVRPVREPAAGAPDAGHPVAARGPQAGDIDFYVVRENTEGEYSSIGGRMFEGTEREMVIQESVFTRHGVDRILRTRSSSREAAAKHLTSATKSNGISITMPYWDERVAAMAAYPDVRSTVPHRHPDRALRAASRLVRRGRRLATCSATSCRTSGPACTGTIGIAPSANINPEREHPVAVRAGARLGAGHRRQGHRQPDRPDLVGRDDARAPRPRRRRTTPSCGDRDAATTSAAGARPRRATASR
jgi:peptide/nickel transport system ATP-binding protein